MDSESIHNFNAKKKTQITTRKSSGAIFMLRCAELGLSYDDLQDMTIGMIYDMCTERANDGAEYDIIAPRGSLRGYIERGCKIG